MSTRHADYDRELGERLDREQQWIQDEKEWVRSGLETEVLAKRTEAELRESLGGTIPGNAVRVTLPSNVNPLAPQDPARRALFIQHLAEMAEGAVLDHEHLEAEPVGSASPASGRETLSQQACAACRGNCCRSGRTHAYLTEETVARSLAAHPDWKITQVMDAYLEHLPAVTYLNSCVFHAATGCGLPRALRSATCNGFRCAKLDTLRALIPENNPPPVLALMFDQGQWRGSALLDETGVKILAEAPPRALPG